MRDWLINLPEELTESDLVAMVEGTLPAEREGVAIAALKQEPRLGLLIKQMRQDRAALAGLQETAPAGVVEQVLDELDRAALRELAEEAQQRSAGVPVSSLVLQRPSAFEILFQSTWMRRLAVAAALVLTAGIGMYGVRVLLNGQQQRALSQPKIALNNNGGPHQPADNASAPEGQPGSARDGSQEVAAHPGPPKEQLAQGEPSPADGNKANGPREQHEAVIGPAMAAALAREGRLTLRVGASGATSEVVRRLEALARGNGRATIGQAGTAVAVVVHGGSLDRVPTQYAMLLRPTAEPAVDVGASQQPREVQPTAVASEQSGTKEAGKAPPIRIPAAAPRALPHAKHVVKAIYFVEIEPTPWAMRDLLALVREPGKEQTSKDAATFKALERGVSQAMPFDAESVLWWAEPSSRWAKPAVVPVVIEGVE